MQKERPLSPHLQVYKLPPTALLSILHRGTGVVLALGTPFLIYWLMQLAAGPEAYAKLEVCLSYTIVQLAIAGWAFALCYHLCNGIRHLVMDTGRGYELNVLRKSDLAVAGGALILAAIVIGAAWAGGAA